MQELQGQEQGPGPQERGQGPREGEQEPPGPWGPAPWEEALPLQALLPLTDTPGAEPIS